MTSTIAVAAPSQVVPQSVALVSGQNAKVLTMVERTWIDQTRDAYLDQTKFSEATDLRDLDRLLIHELMIFRWTQFLAAGVDYDGDMIDEERIRRNIKEYSDQVNKIKDSMGLNKKSRDDAAAEGNFAAWISDLKARAKIFGVHRENQLKKALALFNELASVVGMFDRADAEERRKLGFETEADILDWIRERMLPEYSELDAYFRQHQQRYWVRDM